MPVTLTLTMTTIRRPREDGGQWDTAVEIGMDDGTDCFTSWQPPRPTSMICREADVD